MQKLIRKCDLIIFDEICMMHKHCVEALDVTLRDLTGNDTTFGGKTVSMSGDWRQTAPIVQYGSPQQTASMLLL